MKKILFIDDDELFAKVLIDSLPKDAYEVTHVTNGEEGLKELDKARPDIILLDMMMPKMGGIEFLKVLKTKNQVQKIPILISSELSNINNISEAVTSGLDVGVKGYIIKASQNIEMIIKTIENTLRDSA